MGGIINRCLHHSHSVYMSQDIVARVMCMCLQLKEKVADKFNIALEQICLIYSGKILYDGEELIGRGITDETVVHMVVKSASVQVPVCSDLVMRKSNSC